MNIKLFRVILTLTAFFIGIGLVWALSYAGGQTKGPLENLFTSVSEGVRSVEKTVILQAREEKRSDKLKWYAPYAAKASMLRKPEKILLGAFDNNTTESFQSIVALEDSVATTFPLIQIYTAWGDGAANEFPARQAESIVEMGSTPVITWEPWLTAFNEEDHPELKKIDLRDINGLADVAKGDYDFYIRKWAASAARLKKSMFLRLGHEMNDPYRYPWGPQNNNATEFIAAWKHVRAIFKEEHANNIMWIWSPHPAYGYFKEFYPGDSEVDYVGINTLNYGSVASWSKWWSLDDIFGKYYNDLAAFNKPMMLTELGSLATGGNRSEWFANALSSIPKKYPAVKAVMFFHYSSDRTTTEQTLNWYFKNDLKTTRAIKTAIAGWKAE